MYLINVFVYLTFLYAGNVSSCNIYFSPLGKLAEGVARPIYFDCVNFFFLIIARRQIISGSSVPIFAIFAPNDR